MIYNQAQLYVGGGEYSPITGSLYGNSSENQPFVPPSPLFITTQDGDILITQDGDQLTTQGGL